MAGHPFLTRQRAVETGLGLFKPIVKQLFFYQQSTEICHTVLRYPLEKGTGSKNRTCPVYSHWEIIGFVSKIKPAKNIGCPNAEKKKLFRQTLGVRPPAG